MSLVAVEFARNCELIIVGAYLLLVVADSVGRLGEIRDLTCAWRLPGWILPVQVKRNIKSLRQLLFLQAELLLLGRELDEA